MLPVVLFCLLLVHTDIKNGKILVIFVTHLRAEVVHFD